MAEKVGYAVVGLGHIAQEQVLPAFANAPNARLVALVSDEREKREKLGAHYGVRHLYGYDEYDACLANEEVDAVYVALPNDMHCDYTVRAARAGVHVLCEKPMALDETSCRTMIRACDDAGVKLMIAYRLHFEEANLEAIELLRRGAIGTPRFFTSAFGYQLQGGNIRSSGARGGGPVWDLGVYCVNAARYLFRAEPEEVFAWTLPGRPGDERFAEVEAGATAVLRFSGGRTATFTVDFDCGAVATYRVVGTEGDLRLDNAYEYGMPRVRQLDHGGEVEERRFEIVDQFGPELQYFAGCILEDRQPEPDGEEGLADVRIVEAIFRSAAEGRPVRLEAFERRRRPGEAQAHHLAGKEERPPLVDVEAPSAD
ncbi:Gfo/Idh/MocA family protein [Vulgatibacter sp.]|uniref:Gfo/Idh/MocA family protein n=1 Tax=Vulgatibacter sp. TaxID=1971226 RepID=UPI003568CB05